MRLYFELKSPIFINIDSVELRFTICVIMMYYEKNVQLK